MTDADKTRIEEESIRHSGNNFDRAYHSYKAGSIKEATVWAERLKQERNKVIEDCQRKLIFHPSAIRLLESLKSKPE